MWVLPVLAPSVSAKIVENAVFIEVIVEVELCGRLLQTEDHLVWRLGQISLLHGVAEWLSCEGVKIRIVLVSHQVMALLGLMHVCTGRETELLVVHLHESVVGLHGLSIHA